MMKSNLQTFTGLCVACSSWALVLLISVSLTASAILVQPHNYMLDDTALTGQHEPSGSLSPFYNDAQSGPEEQQDRDIVSIIGDSLARLRFARMLDQNQNQAHQEQRAGGQLSAEMAELLQGEQEHEKQAAGEGAQAGPLSSSVASMLMNAAVQAAAAASQPDEPADSANVAGRVSSRGSIVELDTSQAGAGSSSAGAPASKADLKAAAGTSQWYNPKETIPVLKISSMATPSKYKKVYFRSEKKLVDGAFHSPSASDSSDKKSALARPFSHSLAAANVQRRSSRATGSHSSAPPSVLQDGLVDFLKKFRDVYVQTRPAGAQAAAASPLSLASSIMSAAASSPIASFLAPPPNRPNLMSALSSASQMVSSASQMSQAAAATPAAGASAAAAAASSAPSGGSKAPLTGQNYVSFWSKTFPTWVRKMLKQMRRRSLYNSSKRHQHQHQQHHGAAQAAGQKVANGAVVSSTLAGGQQAASAAASS